MSESWAAKAEQNIELFTNTGRGAEAARMLEITPTNRILIDRDQAIILQIGRLAVNRFINLKEIKLKSGLAIPGELPEISVKKDKVNKYQWMADLLNEVEFHQATIDGKTRLDFKDVAIAQGIGIAQRMKSVVDTIASK